MMREKIWYDYYLLDNYWINILDCVLLKIKYVLFEIMF